MNSRIAFYLLLCILWLVLAVAIFMGFHEGFLGQAEEWKKYLAMGICLLMMCFNVLRIQLIRKAQARSKQPHDNTL